MRGDYLGVEVVAGSDPHEFTSLRATNQFPARAVIPVRSCVCVLRKGADRRCIHRGLLRLAFNCRVRAQSAVHFGGNGHFWGVLGEVVYGLGKPWLKPEPGAGSGRRRGLAGDAVGRAWGGYGPLMRRGRRGWPGGRGARGGRVVVASPRRGGLLCANRTVWCALSNFARNSHVNLSNIELASLELQRFWALLKVHAIELRAKFLGGVSVVTHGYCSLAQKSPQAHHRELRRSGPERTADPRGPQTLRRTAGRPPRPPRVVSGANQGKPP